MGPPPLTEGPAWSLGILGKIGKDEEYKKSSEDNDSAEESSLAMKSSEGFRYTSVIKGAVIKNPSKKASQLSYFHNKPATCIELPRIVSGIAKQSNIGNTPCKNDNVDLENPSFIINSVE